MDGGQSLYKEGPFPPLLQDLRPSQFLQGFRSDRVTQCGTLVVSAHPSSHPLIAPEVLSGMVGPSVDQGNLYTKPSQSKCFTLPANHSDGYCTYLVPCIKPKCTLPTIPH